MINATVAAEIAAARDAFWAAHENGDAAALAELATDDCIVWAPGMEELRGRQMVLDGARGMFSAMAISDFALESCELELFGERAYEFATYSERITPTGGVASPVRGRYLIAWKREPEGWRVQRNMFHFVSGP